MNKRKLLLIISVLTILLISIFIIKFNKNDIEASEYNFDILTDNLALRDITLVSFGENHYISKNYYLEQLSIANPVNNISIEYSLDGKNIDDLSLVDVFVDGPKFYIDHSAMVKNIKLSSKPTLKVKISYISNNKKKEFYETIDLNSKKTNKLAKSF